MSTIKKAYQDIVTFMQEAVANNSKVKVSDILPQVIELASASRAGGTASTFHKDADGNVVAIRCYYHKLWMDPRVAEFGAKANTATGYNSMCKDGMSKWTKQQRDLKKAKEELLNRLSSGKLTIADLPAEQERIEQDATVIVPREDGYGFNTLEELLAAQPQ